MKKIFLFLFIAFPLVFIACDEIMSPEGTTTGSMNITIGGEQHLFDVATYQKKGNGVIITSTEVENTLTITLDSTIAKTYILGFDRDIRDTNYIKGNMYLEIDSMLNTKNALAYFPTGDFDNYFLALMGKVIISEISSEKVVGTFSGYGMRKDTLLVLKDEFKDFILNPGLYPEENYIDSLLMRFTQNTKEFSGEINARSY
ncbi:MAG: hypothetical protein LBM25_04780 [Bacteroidales bacterium]|jgi:hypothetical protein|nr:hypothetical protein [Bacteroidales bacterium]